jgi:hypothetical protein
LWRLIVPAKPRPFEAANHINHFAISKLIDKNLVADVGTVVGTG